MNNIQHKSWPTHKREFFIDVARVLAFTSVVVGHKFYGDVLFFLEKVNEITNLRLLDFVLPLFSGGGFGVVLFFLVSGYVITKAALRETSKQFLISRVFRIYPSLGLALILYWFINTGSSDFTFNSKVWSFSLLGDFNNTPNQLNGVDWTLRLEILFYFACWLILQLKGSKFTSYWRSNDWWIFVLLLLSLVGTLFLPIFPKFGFVGYVTIFASVFVGGAALALFELNTLGRANAIALYLFSLFIHSVQISEIRPDLFGYGAFSFYGYVCFGLLFSSRNKIVSNSFIVLLSNLTYLTYLFHNWALEKFYVFFQPQGDDNGYSLKVRILSLVIFMVSMWVIHVIFEQPFIKLGRRFASKEVRRNYR